MFILNFKSLAMLGNFRFSCGPILPSPIKLWLLKSKLHGLLSRPCPLAETKRRKKMLGVGGRGTLDVKMPGLSEPYKCSKPNPGERGLFKC